MANSESSDVGNLPTASDVISTERDRSSCEIRSHTKSRDRHPNDYELCRPEVQDGFLQLSDPFSSMLRLCPRQTYQAVERLVRTPEPEVDDFGVVSKRSLPEHYYINTGCANGGPTSVLNKRVHTALRDRNTVVEFSHPRCFANPDNNVRLSASAELGAVEPSLTTPRQAADASPSPDAGDADDRNGRVAGVSRLIRFDSHPLIIELIREEETGSGEENDSSGAEDDAGAPSFGAASL